MKIGPPPVRLVREAAGGRALQLAGGAQELIDRAAELFEDGRRRRADEETASQQELYEQIGRLKMELEWLKNLPNSAEFKRSCIQPGHPPAFVAAAVRTARP